MTRSTLWLPFGVLCLVWLLLVPLVFFRAFAAPSPDMMGKIAPYMPGQPRPDSVACTDYTESYYSPGAGGSSYFFCRIHVDGCTGGFVMGQTATITYLTIYGCAVPLGAIMEVYGRWTRVYRYARAVSVQWDSAQAYVRGARLNPLVHVHSISFFEK